MLCPDLPSECQTGVPMREDCAHEYGMRKCINSNDMPCSSVHSAQQVMQLSLKPPAGAMLIGNGVQALHSTDSQSEDAEHSHSEEEEEEELPPFLSDVEAVEVGRECLSPTPFVIIACWQCQQGLVHARVMQRIPDTVANPFPLPRDVPMQCADSDNLQFPAYEHAAVHSYTAARLCTG